MITRKPQTHPAIVVAGGICLALAAAASGQSFNVDIGVAAGVGAGAPAVAFGAAAAQVGHWNNIVGAAAGPFALNNLGGFATPVTVERTAGVALFAFNSACAVGNTELLMDDIEDVGPAGSTVTYTYEGLAPGRYTVFTYAWAPDNEGFRSTVTVPGALEGPQVVGGACPGAWVQGVTHARHTIILTSGVLDVIIDSTIGFGSVNGFQLQRAALACPPVLDPQLTIGVGGTVHYPGGATEDISTTLMLTAIPAAKPGDSTCYSVTGLFPPPEPPDPPLPPATIDEIWARIRFILWMVKSIVEAPPGAMNVLQASCGHSGGTFTAGTAPDQTIGVYSIELQDSSSVLVAFDLDLAEAQPQPDPPIAFEVAETIEPAGPGHATAAGIGTMIYPQGSISMSFSVEIDLQGDPTAELPHALDLTHQGTWDPSSFQAQSQICIGFCAADVTGDSTVNIADLLEVISSWGDCPIPPASCPADVNGDGVVNIIDLLGVIAAWGKCT